LEFFVAVEFVGYKDVQHVANPELPFAAIVSAVSGLSVSAIHKTLVAAGVSEENGKTGPLNKTKLEGKNSAVSIKPIKLMGAKGPEGVLERIEEQFKSDKAVALLHKSNSNSEDDSYHWTLFTGYTLHDGEKGAIHTIDPALERATYLGRHMIRGMIKRSMPPAVDDKDFSAETSVGVFAYALSIDEAGQSGTSETAA
jgi:hypothetical protein